MSNVIDLRIPHRILPPAARSDALIRLFANDRRGGDDVFWLKENAELLNILECTGQGVDPQALEVHAGFYDTAPERLQFFPQYYRFFLSMALDLEALGMPGDNAARMAEFAGREGLAEAELSDLQRAEARRLLARRGVEPVRDPWLDDRLRAFAARSATFALPNKKAAYELTHIVFYLSEYGRQAPNLPAEACRSLHFAGLTAYLEQNADLLAEICIALRWAGDTPPPLWTDWLMRQTAGFVFEDGLGASDAYHEFLVCNWHAAVAGLDPFRTPLAHGATRILAAPRLAPLSEISRAMLALSDSRSGNWPEMRDRMARGLSAESTAVLDAAAESTAHFDAFFEGFARAGGA